VCLIGQVGLLVQVRTKSFSNEVDLHAMQLSGPGSTARASPPLSG
jgi:hypothetical protein